MKIDDNLAFLLTENVSFFENIHPNYITISGIVSNCFIYYLLIKKSYFKMVLFLIIYRYLTDILDGAVARKYKKTSELGGYLDTINDLMFILIISSVYLKKEVIFLISIFCCIMIYSYNLFHDHSQIKNKKIMGFFVNNSILLYILLILFIIYKNTLSVFI